MLVAVLCSSGGLAGYRIGERYFEGEANLSTLRVVIPAASMLYLQSLPAKGKHADALDQIDARMAGLMAMFRNQLYVLFISSTLGALLGWLLAIGLCRVAAWRRTRAAS